MKDIKRKLSDRKKIRKFTQFEKNLNNEVTKLLLKKGKEHSTGHENLPDGSKKSI